MRVECNIPNTDLRLLITDNNNNPLVKSWINCAAAENSETSKLNDNPYQYDLLNKLDRLYTVVVSRNGLPYYGHYIMQYPKLPKDVARIFARAYKTKLFDDKLSKTFWQSEQKVYKDVLAPLLIEKGVGTLFWSRHSDSVGKDMKWAQLCHKFGYPLEHKQKVMFKNNLQNIHYFNIWNSPLPINKTFIEMMPAA